MRPKYSVVLWNIFVCLCTCAFLKKGVCSGDQEKVNYLLVLRCRLASPGWVGSSGARERNGMTEKEEKKGKESLRLA